VRLAHPFYVFPFRFDAERLRAEISALPEDRWCTHPDNFRGNSHLPLISTDGGVNDGFDPPMRPTQSLAECPYLMQVLASFRTLHGRARLMRLEPGDGVPLHFDAEYYWRMHTRVHIPVVTHRDVRFVCGNESVHMAEGEAWTFDNWRMHRVDNPTPVRRIHLTFDTYGSNEFWSMARPHPADGPARFVPFDPAARPALAFETYPGGPVLSPAEIDAEAMAFAADISAAPQNARDAVLRVRDMLVRFGRAWRTLWHERGPAPENEAAFVALRLGLAEEYRRTVPADLTLASNGAPAAQAFVSFLRATTRARPRAAARRGPSPRTEPQFDRPVFIVCAPRSGSTLLFETLAHNRAFWTLGGEGHGPVESIAALAPRSRGFDSNRLTAADATPAVAAELRRRYASLLRDAAGLAHSAHPAPPPSVRFLEKTPKNALRIPFFRAIFPDAKFVHLRREPRANISAIMEAWRSGGFVTYPRLEGWRGPPWSMLLIPGWRELDGRALAEIAMRQWRDTNDIILDDLAALPRGDWTGCGYEDLLARPAAVLEELCRFAGVPFDGAMRRVAGGPLPPSRYTLTPPHPEKWRSNAPQIAPYLSATEATAARMGIQPVLEGMPPPAT
jgi:hypothetical protein